MRALFLSGLVVWGLLAIAGCGDPNKLTPCSVDQYVELSTAGTKPVDCGHFTRGEANYTDDAMVAAQRCVLNAIVRKQSFVLVYDPNTSSGAAADGLRAGWTGVVEGGRLRLHSYAGQQQTDMSTANPFVSGRSCDTVDASDGCKPIVGVPCLDCKGTTPLSVTCRG